MKIIGYICIRNMYYDEIMKPIYLTGYFVRLFHKSFELIHKHMPTSVLLKFNQMFNQLRQGHFILFKFINVPSNLRSKLGQLDYFISNEAFT